MAYRLFDFSSDVGIEADADTPEAALVELARAVSHVLTAGSPIRAAKARPIEVRMGPDWPATAVAFVNEAIYAFDTDHFLTAAGEVRVVQRTEGRQIAGILRGETFDEKRHASGRGVKAATFHDAAHERHGGLHRLRIVLDL